MIIDCLFELQDLEYKEFQSRLMPNIPKDRIIGVRTPDLRTFAKKLAPTIEGAEFLNSLPHRYYEENNLHGALIIYGKYNYEETLRLLEDFLPHIDNWATCDMFVPPILKKRPSETLKKCREWLNSSHPYTIRFGLNCLMHFYLEKQFDIAHFDWVDGVDQDDYYVRMGIAWYYSVALVKQWKSATAHLSQKHLEPWIHNKALQKGRESSRLSKEQKEFLQSLKI